MSNCQLVLIGADEDHDPVVIHGPGMRQGIWLNVFVVDEHVVLAHRPYPRLPRPLGAQMNANSQRRGVPLMVILIKYIATLKNHTTIQTRSRSDRRRDGHS